MSGQSARALFVLNAVAMEQTTRHRHIARWKIELTRIIRFNVHFRFNGSSAAVATAPAKICIDPSHNKKIDTSLSLGALLFEWTHLYGGVLHRTVASACHWPLMLCYSKIADWGWPILWPGEDNNNWSASWFITLGTDRVLLHVNVCMHKCTRVITFTHLFVFFFNT